MRDAIAGETIRLGQLLKLAGIVQTGGEGKALLAEGGVHVNGEPRRAAGASCAPATWSRPAGRRCG